MLCKSLGFNEYETYIILKGAILHDIGKIYIPNSILNKKESLDFKEYEIVKYHPALGSKMLHRLNIDTSVIQDIVLYHHESLDGTGYPLGKLSDSLSSHVKIVTISDVFSAMTSNRSYRNKLSLVKALDYLSQNSDIKFDSLMVRTLIKILS
ncbi:HD domain-containing protein [Clostridium sp. 19966]|nr:HD domain-containing protein [Clostridium sp. 19966]